MYHFVSCNICVIIAESIEYNNEWDEITCFLEVVISL